MARGGQEGSFFGIGSQKMPGLEGSLVVQGLGVSLVGPGLQQYPLTQGLPGPGTATPLTRGTGPNRCTGTNPPRPESCDRRGRRCVHSTHMY